MKLPFFCFMEDLLEVMTSLTFLSIELLVLPSELFLLLSVSLSDGYLFLFFRIFSCWYELKRSYAENGLVLLIFSTFCHCCVTVPEQRFNALLTPCCACNTGYKVYNTITFHSTVEIRWMIVGIVRMVGISRLRVSG